MRGKKFSCFFYFLHNLFHNDELRIFIYVQVHGILNIIGWGVVLPIGVIIARNFREFPLPWLGWKKCHISCQTIGYLVGTTGWAVGIWLGKASKYYSFPKHGTYGLLIFAFATIQVRPTFSIFQFICFIFSLI